MRVLHFLAMGLVAAATLLVGLFVAGMIACAGLVAYVIRLFRGKIAAVRPVSPAGSNRYQSGRADDVIEVETRRVAADPIE